MKHNFFSEKLIKSLRGIGHMSGVTNFTADLQQKLFFGNVYTDTSLIRAKAVQEIYHKMF